eukprot:1699758-Pyramimonas_sp.AAC.1
MHSVRNVIGGSYGGASHRSRREEPQVAHFCPMGPCHHKGQWMVAHRPASAPPSPRRSQGAGHPLVVQWGECSCRAHAVGNASRPLSTRYKSPRRREG